MDIAKILKNCPKGIKLYSPIYGEMEFIKVSEVTRSIHCVTNKGNSHYFFPDGKYEPEGECVLFPSKEQRDWNTFMIPFKDGDVIIKTEPVPGAKCHNIAIFSNYNNNPINRMSVHCQINGDNEFKTRMCVGHKDWRPANAEETKYFFTRMHESGYDFKDGSLTRQFKYGDVVAFYNDTYRGYNIGIFDTYLNNTFCKVLCITLVSDGSVNIVGEKYDIGRGWDTKEARLATNAEKLELLEKLANIGYEWNNNELTPIAKFKVGDIITNGTYTFKVSRIDNRYYYEEIGITVNRILIQKQDGWRIKKFDIRSLKPYDKVLAKNSDSLWYPTLVSYVDSSGTVYIIDESDQAAYVIPFEGNEHLIGKFDDPDPYYITWQE